MGAAVSNVKVSGALPGDWGLRKAEQMTAQRVAKIDRDREREADRETAAEEQRESRRARRAGRVL